MVKLFDSGGSWEFEPGSDEPPKYTPGDAPTEEYIAGRLEDITIEKAKEILDDPPPSS